MKRNRLIHLGAFFLGLMASYAVATPITHQQVSADSKVGRIPLDWTFVTDINDLANLIDKNPLPKNEIDSLADKLLNDYEKSFPIITSRGDYIENSLRDLCNQFSSECNTSVKAKEMVLSLNNALAQYKQDIQLLPSLKNVKEIVTALKNDPKAEKSKLMTLKTSVENAKSKIAPEFENMYKSYLDLYLFLYQQ